ncbi:MAG: hypothetical protein MN733_37815 [Nitrososphaera sp.]|nr:hypothetical protein [Nitrososphaera sp.]
MCGVVGVIGVPSRVNRQVFQDMLCMGAKRGPHSTGIAAANRKQAFIVKDVGLPWDLLRSKGYQENIVGKNWPVLMGHNRWATIGKISSKNAHPFWHKHIIMMHNGTLEKGQDLEHWLTYDTDSECLAWNIAEYGIVPTYKKLSGAWTMTWFDQQQGTMSVVTNGHRPFVFIMSADKKSMFWASEDWIIRFAAEGRGIDLDKTPYNLVAHRLYKFSINRKGIVEYTTEELEGKPIPLFYKGAADYPNRKDYNIPWNDGEDDSDISAYYGYSFTESGIGTQKTTIADGSKTSMTGSQTSNVHVLIDEKGLPLRGGSKESMAELIARARKEYYHGKARVIYKTAAEYAEHFSNSSCVLCGSDLKDDYEDALVIDPETAACGRCHTFSNLNSITLV